MSTFEAVRCDQCEITAHKNYVNVGWSNPTYAWRLPANWMTVTYSIPTNNPTGGMYPQHIQADFCSMKCRNEWEARKLSEEGGAINE